MGNPIDDAAQRCLDVFAENTEDIIDEAAEEEWPEDDGDEIDYASAAWEAHNDRTFAAVVRALIPLLVLAATEAEKRAGKYVQ